MKPDLCPVEAVPPPLSSLTLRSAFAYAARCGKEAALSMLWPAAVIQFLMLLLVVGYYLHWPTSRLLEILSNCRNQSDRLIPYGGLIFNFTSTGFAAGVLAEVFKVYFTQRGRWTRLNLQDALFKFVIIGMGGLTASIFYVLQGKAFGSHVTVQTVVIKVLVDQFVFNPFFAAPFPCFVNHWLAGGLNRKTVIECLTPQFYIVKILPLLFSTWCFWLPMVSLIYSLPVTLQFPLFLCASTIWGLIFTTLINPRSHPEN